MNKHFEKGRECQRLETQISALYEEIFLRSGKNNPEQQATLRRHVQEAFDKYLVIAVQYQLGGQEILRVEEMVYKALGKEYPPKYEKPEGSPF